MGKKTSVHSHSSYSILFQHIYLGIEMRRIVLIAVMSALATVSHAASNEWRLMPVRTQGQFERGEIGGRAEQWMQGAARCKANPNIV